MIEWANVGAVLSAVIVGGEAARRWVVKPVAEILERSRLRDEDWNGVPDRPGVPGRSGVMAVLGEHTDTLSTLNDFASDTNERVTRLETGRKESHAETVKMWSAIEAVAKRPPDPSEEP